MSNRIICTNVAASFVTTLSGHIIALKSPV